MLVSTEGDSNNNAREITKKPSETFYHSGFQEAFLKSMNSFSKDSAVSEDGPENICSPVKLKPPQESQKRAVSWDTTRHFRDKSQILGPLSKYSLRDVKICLERVKVSGAEEKILKSRSNDLEFKEGVEAKDLKKVEQGFPESEDYHPSKFSPKQQLEQIKAEAKKVAPLSHKLELKGKKRKLTSENKKPKASFKKRCLERVQQTGVNAKGAETLIDSLAVKEKTEHKKNIQIEKDDALLTRKRGRPRKKTMTKLKQLPAEENPLLGPSGPTECCVHCSRRFTYLDGSLKRHVRNCLKLVKLLEKGTLTEEINPPDETEDSSSDPASSRDFSDDSGSHDKGNRKKIKCPECEKSLLPCSILPHLRQVHSMKVNGTTRDLLSNLRNNKYKQLRVAQNKDTIQSGGDGHRIESKDSFDAEDEDSDVCILDSDEDVAERNVETGKKYYNSIIEADANKAKTDMIEGGTEVKEFIYSDFSNFGAVAQCTGLLENNTTTNLNGDKDKELSNCSSSYNNIIDQPDEIKYKENNCEDDLESTVVSIDSMKSNPLCRKSSEFGYKFQAGHETENNNHNQINSCLESLKCRLVSDSDVSESVGPNEVQQTPEPPSTIFMSSASSTRVVFRLKGKDREGVWRAFSVSARQGQTLEAGLEQFGQVFGVEQGRLVLRCRGEVLEGHQTVEEVSGKTVVVRSSP